jgi:acetyl esterase/lipase
MAIANNEARAEESFYSVNAGDLHGRPGTLIRQEQLPSAPQGALAYRILYLSLGLHGETIAVSGLVIFPSGPLSGGSRPLVAWAHPTSGVVSKCAPSMDASAFRSIQGLSDMIARGFAVVATDYPGLGTEGPHPYLIGDSEGRAVLDSVRAASQISDINTGRDFAVWGHSQGGQAALYAGLLARHYAPELNLVGIAAAAPATDLETLFSDDLGTPGGKNLTAMTLWSWSRVFGISLDKVVTPQSVPTIDRLSEGCIESFVDFIEREYEEKPLQKSFLEVSDLGQIEPWHSLMKSNSPGLLANSIPTFLAQGTADTTVRPSVTADYASRLCKAGNPVRIVLRDKVGHAFIARDSAAAAVEWMAARFAGKPPPNDCFKK